MASTGHTSIHFRNLFDLHHINFFQVIVQWQYRWGGILKVHIKNLRHTIQIALTLFLLYTGWQFYKFVLHVQSSGSAPFIDKPAAVEGFLPISALLGLKQWLLTGIYDPIHPAGLTIFLAVLLTAFIFKKGFCSWLCPIGALSELLTGFRIRYSKTNIKIPGILDKSLMSIKYLLLAFFAKVIILDMSLKDVQAFLVSPYNLVADIKMLYFFLDIGKVTAIVLLVLVVLSIFIKQFWCRYLCPYGALQGLLSFLSLFKINRNRDLCINCGSCNKSCPGMINVSEKQVVNSPECTGCLNCIDVCPIEGCVTVSSFRNKLNLKPLIFAGTFVGTFFGLLLIAQLTGYWESTVKLETLYRLTPHLDLLKHP